MALSSDEIVKREIIDVVGYNNDPVHLRIFTESSRDDQNLFQEGGLTFGYKGVSYGSCDSCWLTNEEWIDGYNNKKLNIKPFIALEGTDALSRGSSGNAQYQRFHHALGAVKNGVIGIYYLKKGNHKIQPDLFGMAYNASKKEVGDYLVTDDLNLVKELIKNYKNPEALSQIINKQLEYMKSIFLESLEEKYQSDWNNFADKRSTVIYDDYVIKYAARNVRNFTESSQRAGHIALGEMYLTKYLFPGKMFYYLFARMSSEDLVTLDTGKSTDKEWYLLRNEANVKIITSSDLVNVPEEFITRLRAIKNESLLRGTNAYREYKSCMEEIFRGLKDGRFSIILSENE